MYNIADDFTLYKAVAVYHGIQHISYKTHYRLLALESTELVRRP